MHKTLFSFFLLIVCCTYEYSFALDDKHGAQAPKEQRVAPIARNSNNVKVNVVTPVTLEKGKPASITIRPVERATGKPLTNDRLKEVHTKKMHVLAVDHTLTDYQHLHPTPSNRPGEYKFAFTPRNHGAYRLWVDITPLDTDEQEYTVFDLQGIESGTEEVVRIVNNSVTVDGLTFQLAFDTPLKVGTSSVGKVVISKDGKPFAQLEPVMGAFAHVVAINKDRNTIAHVHPMGKEPSNQSDRGGPELQFHIEPTKQGFTKIFVQVRVNGKDIFAPFGVMVE